MGVSRIGILLFIFSEIFISCGNPSEELQTPLPQLDTSVRYGALNYSFPKVSERAKSEIIKWSVFEDYENEVKNINGGNIETLLSSSERLLAHTDSLTKSIPESLNTSLVTSRLIVVNTRVGMLHQEIRMSRLDSVKIMETISALNIATKDLVFQIDEKFTKETIDEQQKEEEENELRKQKKFRDSVYQAELRDKSNR